MKATITIKGIQFNADFDYTPAEPEVWYYKDGSGHPGTPAEVEVISLHHDGHDWTWFCNEHMDMVTEAIWEALEQTT
jgi:hypothetical protein